MIFIQWFLLHCCFLTKCGNTENKFLVTFMDTNTILTKIVTLPTPKNYNDINSFFKIMNDKSFCLFVLCVPGTHRAQKRVRYPGNGVMDRWVTALSAKSLLTIQLVYEFILHVLLQRLKCLTWLLITFTWCRGKRFQILIPKIRIYV